MRARGALAPRAAALATPARVAPLATRAASLLPAAALAGKR